MAVFKGHIVKTLIADPSRTWRNIYDLKAANTPAAMIDLQVIAAAEAAMHGVTVSFLEFVVYGAPVLGGVQRFFPVGVVGERPVADIIIPQYNTVRVDFTAPPKPRPERKYYRLGLDVSFTQGQVWTDTLITDIQSVIDTLVAGGVGLCAPDGTDVTSGFVVTPIQMRQIKWGRRARKGFHRAYVPNV